MSAASTRLARAILESASVADVQPMLNHEPSHWLRTRLARIDREALNGRVTICAHVRPGWPGIVALWAPAGLWCPACAVDAIGLEGDDNFRCDRCGALDDPIHVCTIAGRHAVVLFGLCASCRRREVAA